MPALKTVYVCSACGHKARRWMGKCPSCESWNTLQERAQAPAAKANAAPVFTAGADDTPQSLPQVPMEDFARTATGIGEFDRVLGGGIVQGSVVLVGGDPGIGKSTLLLQAAENLGRGGYTVLYVTGEESKRQVALRAGRLGAASAKVHILSETNAQRVLYQCEGLKPDYMVVDSIQTMYMEGVASSAGSVTQVREAAAAFMRYAKNQGCPTFLVGHMTKAGSLAGPRVLEHMVDTVLYFEGDSQHAYRVLRAEKNRFGSTNEIGIFEMREEGMAEIQNPSEMFLSGRVDAAGSVVAACQEGTRPMLVEIQALVCASAFGTPRRMSTGVDYNRMVLLAAVLEKRAGLRLYGEDIYLNVVGGLRLNEPAADLPAAMAMASGLHNQKTPAKTAVFGEVGLTGEVRPVSRADSRVNECAKAGYTTIILPRRNLRGLNAPKGVELLGVGSVNEALQIIL